MLGFTVLSLLAPACQWVVFLLALTVVTERRVAPHSTYLHPTAAPSWRGWWGH